MINWGRVVVAVPNYSGNVRRECQQSIDRLGGATVLRQVECSDVSQARSSLYTRVVRQCRASHDVMLCVDDDIAFSLATAERVVRRCVETGHPVSAVYGCLGQIAASRPKPALLDENGQKLWLTGLGFTAVPMRALVALAKQLELVIMMDGTAYPFSTSGPFVWDAEPQWYADDYSFCRRLGGVILEPVEVAHIKMAGMLPDEETLRRIASGEMLDERPGQKQSLEDARASDEFWRTPADVDQIVHGLPSPAAERSEHKRAVPGERSQPAPEDTMPSTLR